MSNSMYKKNNLCTGHINKTEQKEYTALSVGSTYGKPMSVYNRKVTDSVSVEPLKPLICEEDYSTTHLPKEQKHSTPVRKYSDNCDSNDETQSMSSINTKDSIYSKTPKALQKSTDFKVKYKTEICKYWAINQSCKFGDNVSLVLM
jgi:hypothetical protein